MLFQRRQPKESRQIQHPLAHQLYSYVLGDIYYPGAPSEVLIPLTANPLYSFHGPGRVPRGSLRVLQPKPVAATGGTMLTGLGGFVAGQFILQPLVVPPSGEQGS